MSKLTPEERKKLKPSDFALPPDRFPIPDASHAKNAKARAAEALKKKWISQEEFEQIIRKANAVIEKEKHKKK